ncbi:MAG: class I SAM-dependent methyltransferase [Sphingobacteriales bacterium]|nr:class I SAM-dependent methyltransferase [Sphingobacteriales bacterium]
MSSKIKVDFRSYIKSVAELFYWKFKKLTEKDLTNWHYKYFYTTNFDLSDSFYEDKVILDIGCGPRGSLEWADMTKERYGIDPLIHKYQNLGLDKHKMKYVQGYSENLPFDDHYFDVICSFNSIDHVDDIRLTSEEIKRTLKKGGLFLLMVDIHQSPTITEPQTLKWDFLKEYFPEFTVLEERHLHQVKKRALYSNVRKNDVVSNESAKYGVLVAKLKK